MEDKYLQKLESKRELAKLQLERLSEDENSKQEAMCLLCEEIATYNDCIETYKQYNNDLEKENNKLRKAIQLLCESFEECIKIYDLVGLKPRWEDLPNEKWMD